MPGSDFHVRVPFNASPAWEGVLQFETESGRLPLPFSHIQQHSDTETTTDTVEQATELLRASWPNATIGLLQRKQLGRGIYHPEAPGSRLFEWIACKELNPVCEGVWVEDLWLSEGWLCDIFGQWHGIDLEPCSKLERKPLAVSTLPPENEEIPERPADAQIWSFTGAEPWVISLPVLATIILLMINPTKKANIECPDRELSWFLNLLHWYSRKRGPEGGERLFSWSLGTFPDCWMYLHFIFHYFSPGSKPKPEKWKGSGVRCDRRAISLATGGRAISFCEERVWLGMRTATPYKGEKVSIEGPATVGFAMSESFYFTTNATKKQWLKRGLESPGGASGVALFQLFIYHGISVWSKNWNWSLDHIEKLHEVEDEVLTGKHPEKLRTLMFDPSGQLAKENFLTAHLLKRFRKHIEVLPRSLRQMHRKWESTYSGQDSDLLERFDEATQIVLLKNWDKIIARADELYVSLTGRIDKRAAELLGFRDSLHIARNCAANHPVAPSHQLDLHDVD